MPAHFYNGFNDMHDAKMVFELDSDPLARAMALTYAKLIRLRHPELSARIEKAVAKYNVRTG